MSSILVFVESAEGAVKKTSLEAICYAKAMGGDVRAFLGLAGIGDLVATCNSTLSRNFTVGYKLAQGQTLPEILESMEEVAEGINTTKIVKRVIEHQKVRAPITEALYSVLFEGLPVERAINLLMRYPYNVDIDFI